MGFTVNNVTGTYRGCAAVLLHVGWCDNGAEDRALGIIVYVAIFKGLFDSSMHHDR